jgi:NADPH2:quinone reductase
MGLFIGEKLPFILGTNIAGTIIKFGPEVTKYTPGDDVFGLGKPGNPTPDMSGLQEYALLDAESSAKIPVGFSLDEMVTFPVNAVTSYNALFHEKGFGFPAPINTKSAPLSPETIVIIGGGSNVGKFGIQFAKMAGIGKVVTIASAANTDTLKNLGATHVIDRHAAQESIIEQVHAITGKNGATHIYDCVSWEFSVANALLPTSGKGILLVLHPVDDAEAKFKSEGLDCRVTFVVGNSEWMGSLTHKFWEFLPEWIKEKKLEVSRFKVIEGLDLKLIEEGLDSYKDGKPVIPVVVHPQNK